MFKALPDPRADVWGDTVPDISDDWFCFIKIPSSEPFAAPVLSFVLFSPILGIDIGPRLLDGEPNTPLRLSIKVSLDVTEKLLTVSLTLGKLAWAIVLELLPPVTLEAPLPLVPSKKRPSIFCQVVPRNRLEGLVELVVK